jgi:hypothetical protein
VIRLKDLLRETVTTFNNWQMPSNDVLRREFKVEHEMKGLSYFDSPEEFIDAVKGGKIITVNDSLDKRISRRSRTADFKSLLRLIKNYRSYPEFRNERTLQDLYDGFKEGRPMELPIIFNLPGGKLMIFSGNTRMDVAFQLGIEPKAILVDIGEPGDEK